MLWTDAIFVNTNDLMSLDSEIADVAQAEVIQLDGVGGIIQRSIEECGRSILMGQMGFAGFLVGDSLSANHLQAVFNIGIPAVERSRILLDQVVVSGPNNSFWSDIKNWVAYKTISSFYRSAARRNLNDRYIAKRDDYIKETTYSITPKFERMGLPVVYKPMACPAAVMAHSPGSFSITAQAGAGSVTPGSYDVVLTYLDSTQSTNNESHPSATVTVSVTAGQNILADITNLNPPNGQGNPIDIAQCIITPLTATHWNLYAAPTGATPILQNQAPIPIATKQYTLSSFATYGIQVGLGQSANQRLVISRTLKRG